MFTRENRYTYSLQCLFIFLCSRNALRDFQGIDVDSKRILKMAALLRGVGKVLEEVLLVLLWIENSFICSGFI